MEKANSDWSFVQEFIFIARALSDWSFGQFIFIARALYFRKDNACTYKKKRF